MVKRQLGNSRLRQKIFLGHDAERIDFITKIHWQERHKLLKVVFPVSVYTNEALHEVQFGYVKRPTHRSRRSGRDRYEVSNQRWTAARARRCSTTANMESTWWAARFGSPF